MPVSSLHWKTPATPASQAAVLEGLAGRQRDDSKFHVIYFCFTACVPSWTRARETCICYMGSPVSPGSHCAAGCVLSGSWPCICAPVHVSSPIYRPPYSQGPGKTSLVLRGGLDKSGGSQPGLNVREMSHSWTGINAACQQTNNTPMKRHSTFYDSAPVTGQFCARILGGCS